VSSSGYFPGFDVLGQGFDQGVDLHRIAIGVPQGLLDRRPVLIVVPVLVLSRLVAVEARRAGIVTSLKPLCSIMARFFKRQAERRVGIGAMAAELPQHTQPRGSTSFKSSASQTARVDTSNSRAVECSEQPG